jgi:murein DD-endopeptidase MepM/ murein hydrolase activator NlpD
MIKAISTFLILLATVSLPVYAAVDVKSLWKTTRKSPTHSVKKLWKHSASSSKHQSVDSKHKETTKPTLTRIQDSQNTLKETAAQKKQMNRQLEKIARAIQKAELESIAISKVLDRLEQDQKKSETRYQTAKTAIDQYGGKIQKMDLTIRSRRDAFIQLLVDQFALIAAMETIERSTVDSVVRQEIYDVYKQKNNHELENLKTQIDGSKEVKAKLLTRQNQIKESIRAIVAKRALYQKKKAQKTKLLQQLAQKEEEYRTQIKGIMQRQDLLRQTLAKLNILRKEEAAEAKRIEAERRVELKRKTAELKRLRKEQAVQIKKAKAQGRAVSYAAPHLAVSSTAAGSVRQYGSSYQANNIKAYRGARTISPIAHARVVKRFGTYVDPIYKIKIFNDNIVLKSSKPGAKVRNVLNGKVVYVGQNSMLGKVVIVEHGNRLHTIYAALNRISPMLKNGSRVKKGVIIGRIKHKLIFQATQNSKYINPLRLIRL